EYVGVREEIMRNLHGEGLGVSFRIVESDFVIQMSKVAPSETLRDPQCVTMQMPHRIERGLVIESGGFNNQRIALPASRRIAVECWQIEFLRKPAAVRVKLTGEVARFV